MASCSGCQLAVKTNYLYSYLKARVHPNIYKQRLVYCFILFKSQFVKLWVLENFFYLSFQLFAKIRLIVVIQLYVYVLRTLFNIKTGFELELLLVITGNTNNLLFFGVCAVRLKFNGARTKYPPSGLAKPGKISILGLSK
jgi:hypothetical protein